MKNLLSPNTKLLEQKFANFIEESSIQDFKLLSIDPMICDTSLLGHLALAYNLNIEKMKEKEIRAFIKRFLKNESILGTAKAVENTLSVVFQNAKLIEWFEADDLEVGEFRIGVTVKADENIKYDARKFSLSNRLINEAKNVRSHLKDFEVKLPDSHCDIAMFGAGAVDIKLSKKLTPLAGAVNTFIGGYAIWNI